MHFFLVKLLGIRVWCICFAVLKILSCCVRSRFGIKLLGISIVNFVVLINRERLDYILTSYDLFVGRLEREKGKGDEVPNANDYHSISRGYPSTGRQTAIPTIVRGGAGLRTIRLELFLE